MQVSIAAPNASSLESTRSARYIPIADRFDSSTSRLDRYLHGAGVHRISADRLVTSNWIVAFRRSAENRFLATPLRELAIQAINEMPGSAKPEISWETSTSLCVSFTWRRSGEPDLSDAYLSDFGLMRSWVDVHCRIRSQKLGGFVPEVLSADI
ncbi:hypothetical protein [Lysobacter sp. Hz 25]|uniref:hypothetical protein n=1 Tax=Lysobacter sp. Hz 25 TaxID=3383698 RepID=UPI0038D38FD2